MYYMPKSRNVTEPSCSILKRNQFLQHVLPRAQKAVAPITMLSWIGVQFYHVREKMRGYWEQSLELANSVVLELAQFKFTIGIVKQT